MEVVAAMRRDMEWTQEREQVVMRRGMKTRNMRTVWEMMTEMGTSREDISW